MGFSLVIFLVGIGVLLWGAVGAKATKPARRGKRWLIIIGVILVLVGLVLGLPDFIQGLREGWKDGTASDGK